MYLKEYLYTLKNWRATALSAAFAAFLAVVTLLAPRGDERPAFLFFALYFVSIQGFATGQRRLVEDLVSGTGILYLRSGEPIWKIVSAKWAFEVVVPLGLLALVLAEVALLDDRTLALRDLAFLVACCAAFPGLVLVVGVFADPRTFNVFAPFFLFVPASVVLEAGSDGGIAAAAHALPLLNAAVGMHQVAYGEPVTATLALSLLGQAALCAIVVVRRYQPAALAAL